MKILAIDKTWCEYLSPCPYFNTENNPSNIMIGDYDCYNCKHCAQYNNEYIKCIADELFK